MDYKVCTQCKRKLPANNIYFQNKNMTYKSNGKWIYSSSCKICMQAKAGLKQDEKRRKAYGFEVGGGTLKLTTEQWWYTLEYFDFQCAYCRIPMEKTTLSLEHMVPLSQGGEYVFGNIIPACMSCNTVKGTFNWRTWTKNHHRDSLEKIDSFLLEVHNCKIGKLAL